MRETEREVSTPKSLMFSVWLGHSQAEKQQIAAMTARKLRHYSQ